MSLFRKEAEAGQEPKTEWFAEGEYLGKSNISLLEED